MIDVRLLRPDEGNVLDRVAPDVFDNPIDPALRDEFLRDPRHHLAVALAPDGLVVGMASGFHHVHPDKSPQMFINEVGVAAEHRRRGIGRRLVDALLERAAALSCSEAWVATEVDNDAAIALYRSAGGRPDDSQAVVFTFDPAPGAEGEE